MGEIGRPEARSPVVVGADGSVRVGIVGAGKAARFHLDAIAGIEGAEVVSVMSRSGTTARALADSCAVEMATDRLADLLVPGFLDAVVVAVPPVITPSVCEAVLSAGIPLLVEKPAALGSAEVLRLAALAAERSTLAMVAVNRRYYSLVQTALHVVRQRGPVRGVLVEGHEPVDLLMRQGSIDASQAAEWFLVNSVHYVDLVRMVGGEVADVVAVRSAHKVPSGDHFSASIQFQSGVVGTYLAHWSSGAPQVLRIFGDDVEAEVRLSPPEAGWVRFGQRRRIRLEVDHLDASAKPGVVAQDVVFLRAVASGSAAVPWPASSLDDHASTMELAEAILGSGEHGRSPASVST